MNLKYKLFGLRFSVPIEKRTLSISAERIKAAVQNPFFQGLKDMLLVNRGEFSSEVFDTMLNDPMYFPNHGEIKKQHIEIYTNILIGFDTETNKQHSWDVIGMNDRPFQFDILHSVKGVRYLIGAMDETRLLSQTGNYSLFIKGLQHPEQFKSNGRKLIMIKSDIDNPCCSIYHKENLEDSDLFLKFDEWNKGIFNV